MKIRPDPYLDLDNIGTSMYAGDIMKCNLELNYGNGKVKNNGHKLEPDGETSLTKLCKHLDVQSRMKNDKRFGLICVPCYIKMHPPKKK